MKISHLLHKPSMQVSVCFGGHSNLNRGQRTHLLYLQPNIGSHWGLTRSEFTAPLGTTLLHCLSSLSSSHAAQIQLQSHSLTQPFKAVLWCCLLLQLTYVSFKGLFAENVAMLRVSVQDVNEEPVFLSDTYSARIPNSVPYKYPVITVQVKYPPLPFIRPESFVRFGFLP